MKFYDSLLDNKREMSLDDKLERIENHGIFRRSQRRPL